MKRRNISPFSSSRPFSGGHNNNNKSMFNANSLIFLLLAGIIIWVFLCFYIHLQISSGGGVPTRFRTRLMLSNPDHQESQTEEEESSQHDAPRGPRSWHVPTANKAKADENGEEEEGISACLLVNDENPRLPEWIAYHYYILPLRSLIVAVDPSSRSIPTEILYRWKSIMKLDIQLWHDEDYMPHGGDGACNQTDPGQNCLMQHRKRQQHFIRACMKDFKARGKEWVLLTDVDEYITFNEIKDNDPPAPLDEAPDGIPIMTNWTWSRKGYNRESDGKRITGTFVDGTIYGLPDEGIINKGGVLWAQGTGTLQTKPVSGKEVNYTNGQHLKTPPLINSNDEIFYGAYGSIFTDNTGQQWFLRDDYVYRDGLDHTLEDAINHSMPIINNSYVKDNILYGTVVEDSLWNDDDENDAVPVDRKYKDGQNVKIETNWREAIIGDVTGSYVRTTPIKTLYGGHLIKDTDGEQYYLIRDTYLWPPHLSTTQFMDIRKRLPKVGDGTTLLDVINSEMARYGAELGKDYIYEAFEPCMALPRMLYGSREDMPSPMAPDGFNDVDFVTLRYRWHALPDNRVNKYQKNLIDVTRLAMGRLRGEASNIHTPVHHYCRKNQPPRYTTSFFRVNHYLDSFESYSYRNDARSDKRNCRSCYNEKGNEAMEQFNEDIRPWLKGFVASVGIGKAKKLLQGAGNFVNLPPIKLVETDDDHDDDDYEERIKARNKTKRGSIL